MKKMYLVIIFGFSSYSSSAQTVIDYQNWAGSTACNIFAISTDVPATNPDPIFLSHLSTVGQPQFDWINGSVNLKTSNTGGIRGSEYRITYPFKKGFTYFIQVVAAVQNNGLMVELRLNLHNGTNGQSSFCLGVGMIDPTLSGGLRKTNPVQSSVFSNINFDWNNLVDDFSYVDVGAIPSAGVPNQTVLIRKITITEVPPPPTFTVSLSSSEVICGSSDPIIFTINNLYATSGISNHAWNLGPVPNGWLLPDNSPAPEFFTTGNSNTLMLIPDCGKPLSAVSGIITANGNNYNTTNAGQPDIALPTVVIDGLASICSGNSVYSVTNLPCDASVVWSIYPTTGIASLSSVTGNSTSLTKTGDGMITLTGTVTACGETESFFKSVYFGLPDAPIGLDIIDPMRQPDFLCPNANHRLDAAFTFMYPEYHWFLPSGWSSPDWGSGLNTFISTAPVVRVNTGPYQMAAQIVVRGKNGCGYGPPLIVNTSTEDCGYLIDYNVFPNPASNIITIQSGSGKTRGNSGNSARLIHSILIYDNLGMPAIHKKLPSGLREYSMDITSLRPGMYFVEISDGKSKVRRALKIQR